VARVLSTAVVLALLAATGAAFVLTERAKLEHSPIAGTRVTPVFSPDARDPAKRTAAIAFRLRKSERVEVWIEDRHRDKVRTLLHPRSFRAGSQLDLVWDGFSDNGIAVADGTYMPVVKLFRSHRTIGLPSAIRIDTTPPTITVRHPQYPIISPDGDRHHDSFTVSYRLNEPAHAILLVRGKQTVFTLGRKETGELVWNGKPGGRPAAPGRYVLSVAAQDTAGNVSKGVPFAIAQVRYVVLARDRVVVRPGGRFAIRVSTDAPTVSWRLNGRSGVLRRGTLHLRAPRSSGVFHLYVEAAGHAAKCAVVVP
jgi:hypothetical protein